MKTTTKLLFFAVLSILYWGCTYDFPEQPELTSGSADFSTYVAIGNSLTAGYMNGALYNEGQKYSMSALLAEQMKSYGGGTFDQPEINSENGFNTAISQSIPGISLGRLVLKTDPSCPTASPGPTPLIGNAIEAYTGDISGLNNFGFPGMKLVYATNGPAASLNPYYQRLFSSQVDAAATSPLAIAAAANGTFFSVWLGNNDVLGYATSGGTVPTSGMDFNDPPTVPDQIIVGVDPGDGSPIFAPNPVPAGASSYYITPSQADQNNTGENDMTPNSTFSDAYNAVISTLTANGAKGVVANIPNVNDIPFFTTVDPALLAIPLDLGQIIDGTGDPTIDGKSYADVLNGLYYQYGFIGFDQVSTNPLFTPDDKNYLVMETFDADGNRKIRQLDPDNDLVTLAAASMIDSIGLGPITDCDIPTGKNKAGWGLASNVPLTAEGDIDLTNLLINFAQGKVNPYPMPSFLILDESEKAAVKTRIDEFNSTISDIVSSQSSLALVDINTIFSNLVTNGVSIGGSALTASVEPPFGAFSLDGVHPNSRGYAFIANSFIEAINKKFNADLILLNPNDYPGNSLPQ